MIGKGIIGGIFHAIIVTNIWKKFVKQGIIISCVLKYDLFLWMENVEKFTS